MSISSQQWTIFESFGSLDKEDQCSASSLVSPPASFAHGESFFRVIHTSTEGVSLACYTLDGLSKKYEIAVGRTVPHDSLMFADFLSKNLYGSQVLDVGCGTGILSIHICSLRGDVQSTGIEISRAAFSSAQANIRLNGLEGKCEVLLDDFFKLRQSRVRFDTIVCNPPMLPGEIGFVVGPCNVPFVDALLHWLITNKSACRDVFVHYFNFIGIMEQTGNWPSLKQLAAKYGFELLVMQTGLKQLSLQSRTRRAIPKLCDYFPYGEVVVDHNVLPLHSLRRNSRFPEESSIAVPHSFVCLRRR